MLESRVLLPKSRSRPALTDESPGACAGLCDTRARLFSIDSGPSRDRMGPTRGVAFRCGIVITVGASRHPVPQAVKLDANVMALVGCKRDLADRQGPCA